MITKDSVNDNISSNQMIMLQSPEVIATLTIMIITTTIIIIITTKTRAIIVMHIVSILQKLVTTLFSTLHPPLPEFRICRDIVIIKLLYGN